MPRHRLRGARIACTALLLLFGAVVCVSDSKLPTRRGLPDSMTTAWSATVYNGEEGLDSAPQAAFSTQAVALPDLGEIQIRNPTTGRMLHRIPVREGPADVAIASGVVVAQTGPARDDLAYGMLRGYDVSSGRQLWAQNIGVGHVLQTRKYSYSWDDGAAVVTSRGVVAVTRSGDLTGLDLKTGRRQWTRRRPCAAAGTVSATATRAVLLCDKGPLVLVDPQTGQSRQVKTPGPAVVMSTTADAIGVSSSFPDDPEPDTLTVVAESGKLLGRIEGSSSLVSMNDGQAVTYSDGELRAVNLAHGTDQWRRQTEGDDMEGDVRGTYANVSASDGMVLVNRMPPQDEKEEGYPGATTLTDPSGKTTPPLPWPVSGEFAGAVPGLVFVVSQAADQYQFTALRLDNKNPPAPQLGGVRPSDWPDPCRLLTPRQLATLGRGYTGYPAPPSRLAKRLRLPRTDQCDFAGQHPFSLRVGWVAADDTAAASLTQSLLPSFADGLWQAGPNGYQYFSQSPTALPVADRAVVIRGRLVITVFAPRQVALTTKIARLLQTAPPSPNSPGALDKAIAEKTVKDHGFTPAIQLWPPIPGPLRAVYATCGFECYQVLLFHGSRLVGAPPGESTTRPTYRYLDVARQDGRTVQLVAGVYPSTGPQVPVRYVLIELRISGNRLMYRVHHGPWQAAPAAPYHR